MRWLHACGLDFVLSRASRVGDVFTIRFRRCRECGLRTRKYRLGLMHPFVTCFGFFKRSNSASLSLHSTSFTHECQTPTSVFGANFVAVVGLAYRRSGLAVESNSL